VDPRGYSLNPSIFPPLGQQPNIKGAPLPAPGRQNNPRHRGAPKGLNQGFRPPKQGGQPKQGERPPKPRKPKTRVLDGPPVTPDEADPLLSFLSHINPAEFDYTQQNARYYVIKSYTEDDVYKSIKYGVWASTDNGNKRLDKAYKDHQDKGPIYLFFSVNSSTQFCGVAQMISPLDFEKKASLWNQDKWNGQFQVKWIFIKDIPNSTFRHILLSNNENKPITNSRDTQDVLLPQGQEFLKIFAEYKFKSSLLDDFGRYNKAEEIHKEVVILTKQSAARTEGKSIEKTEDIGSVDTLGVVHDHDGLTQPDQQ